MTFEWVKSDRESYNLGTDFGLNVHVGRWENNDNHKGDWSIALPWKYKPIFIRGIVGFDYVRLQTEEMIRGHLMEVIRQIESRS